MPSYRVIWEGEVEAPDPRAAGEKALAMQRRGASAASYFTVVDEDGVCYGVDANDGPCSQLQPIPVEMLGRLERKDVADEACGLLEMIAEEGVLEYVVNAGEPVEGDDWPPGQSPEDISAHIGVMIRDFLARIGRPYEFD